MRAALPGQRRPRVDFMPGMALAFDIGFAAAEIWRILGMPLIVLIVVTSLIFLAAEVMMLPNVIKPLFERHLGDTLLGDIRYFPAALFYVVYMGGVVWFAGWPALRERQPSTALLNGAILGFVAYGTYELTSWTVMRDWHPTMVAVDMLWGTVLTAVAAWGGVMAARTIG